MFHPSRNPSLLSVLVLALCYMAFAVEAQTSGVMLQSSGFGVEGEINLTLTYPEPLPCEYYPGYTVGNRSREFQCCEKVVHDYKREWLFKGYLTKFLETLQGWNCSQLSEECASPTFAHTAYNKLVYMRFCNPQMLLSECETKVETLAKHKSKAGNVCRDDECYLQRWKGLAQKVDFLKVEDFSDPCIEVAMYDSPSERYGSYHEVIVSHVPFCHLTTCGYDVPKLKGTDASVWNCMTSTCRANIIVVMVVLAILALLVIVSNVTVLYVLLTSPKLRNSQAFYKLSLAFADLVIGLIVFPTFIVSLSLLTTRKHLPGESVTVQGYSIKLLNETGYKVNATALTTRGFGTGSLDYFSYSYLATVGFFTSVSLIVSVYTLMLASIDRLYAVSLPLRFKQGNTTRTAACSLLALWVVAIIFGTMPLYRIGMNYGLVASVLVSYSGSRSLYMYIIAFAFPLVTVWITTSVTHCASKRHSRVRRQLTHHSDLKRLRKMEARLAKTLGLMVAVFSASIFPTALVLVIPFFVGNIYYSRPERLDPNAAMAYNSAEFVGVLILAANSLWNCFIYGLRNLEFRTSAKLAYARLFRTIGLVQISNKLSNFISSKHGDRRISGSTDAGCSKRSQTSNTAVVKFTPTSWQRRKTLDMTLDESPNGSHANQAVELQSWRGSIDNLELGEPAARENAKVQDVEI